MAKREVKGPVLGARLLREELERRDWSMGRLERELDIADGLVGRWIRNMRRPELTMAIRLQDLLSIPARAWTERDTVKRKKAA